MQLTSMEFRFAYHPSCSVVNWTLLQVVERCFPMQVLGTLITEWREGAELCRTLLQSSESVQLYASRLAELAHDLGFDGWLVCYGISLESILSIYVSRVES